MTTDLTNKRIEIKPEWQDEGDDKFTWIVKEDKGNRVLVQCIIPDFHFNPTETVFKDMIGKFFDPVSGEEVKFEY